MTGLEDSGLCNQGLYRGQGVDTPIGPSPPQYLSLNPLPHEMGYYFGASGKRRRVHQAQMPHPLPASK